MYVNFGCFLKQTVRDRVFVFEISSRLFIVSRFGNTYPSNPTASLWFFSSLCNYLKFEVLAKMIDIYSLFEFSLQWVSK